MEENVFEAKTVDEAILDGLSALHITLDEAEIEVLEEGKKKLFGSVKAKVRITKKSDFLDSAVSFLNTLFKKMNVEAECVKDESATDATIIVTSQESAKIIGKQGEVLNAIQTLAGAVANIGSDEYKKVIVDCEAYRNKREETLKNLANKVAKAAVEKGKKVSLEPMSPYERRIIHSQLAEFEGVKTISEGKEPMRYVSVIPDGCDPYERGIKFGGARRDGGRGRNDRRGRGKKEFSSRSSKSTDRPRSGGGAKRGGKKEIHFGTFLGNSGNTDGE